MIRGKTYAESREPSEQICLAVGEKLLDSVEFVGFPWMKKVKDNQEVLKCPVFSEAGRGSNFVLARGLG